MKTEQELLAEHARLIEMRDSGGLTEFNSAYVSGVIEALEFALGMRGDEKYIYTG